jgi:hypothetical protein
MEKSAKIIKDFLVPLLTAITAISVVFLNHSVSKTNITIEEKFKEIENQREERESLQGFNLKIYEIVANSIKTGDLQQQEAAKAFVVVMVNEPLRSSFLNVLKQGGTPEIKEDVGQIIEQENKFNSENIDASSIEQTQRFNWEDWDYDIFWCTSSGSLAESQANQIQNALLSEGAKGSVRVRELPESINARSGYQIRGYAIRKNEGEEEQAQALKSLSEKTLANVDAIFTVGVSTQVTSWYISAFVCP